MIATEPIQEIIKLSILTGYLAEEKIVSSILVAEPESYKTELLKKFIDFPNIMYLGDLNYPSLIEEILPHIMEHPEITHIVIPDFLKVVQKKASTAHNTLNILNQMTEDGVFQIPYWRKIHDFKGLQVGIVTAITRKVLADKRHVFKKIGFLSRLIPISYQYSLESLAEIDNYTRNEDYLEETLADFTLQLGERKESKVYGDPELFRFFDPLVAKHRILEETYGFRYRKHLQRLAKANALQNGRDRVMKEDISRIIKLAEYMNLGYKEI